MSASATSTDSHAEKRDHRQEVTDSIIAMLENGVAPWQKPWEGAAMPFNPTSQKSYRGGNTVYLMDTALSRGYEDPRWMTYKQAAEQGWQVRKGERGTHIEYWEVKDQSRRGSTEPDQGEAAKDKSDRRLIHRVYTVFNAKQIDGIRTMRDRKSPLLKPSKAASAFWRTPARGSPTTKVTEPSTTASATASTCPSKRHLRTLRATTEPPCMSSHTGLDIRHG
jgi:antirestriction protein ArdC